MLIFKIILLIITICFLSLILLVLLTKDLTCYAILCGDRKPSNILERIRYKIFLMCGVSPSGLTYYQMDKNFKYFIEGFEKGLNNLEKLTKKQSPLPKQKKKLSE